MNRNPSPTLKVAINQSLTQDEFESPSTSRGTSDHSRKSEKQRLAALRAGALLQSGGLMRLPEVLAVIPVSASTWWQGCREKKYPAAVRLSARCTAWKAEDIRETIERLSKAVR